MGGVGARRTVLPLYQQWWRRACRPPSGDDYFDDDEPIGSVGCVVGEAGIYQKVIIFDLEKAVKAVGSVITGGHLGF